MTDVIEDHREELERHGQRGLPSAKFARMALEIADGQGGAT